MAVMLHAIHRSRDRFRTSDGSHRVPKRRLKGGHAIFREEIRIAPILGRRGVDDRLEHGIPTLAVWSVPIPADDIRYAARLEIDAVLTRFQVTAFIGFVSSRVSLD